MQTSLDRLQARMDEYDDITARNLEEEYQLSQLRALEPSGRTKYTQNSLTDMQHAIASTTSGPNVDWTTFCGWKFGLKAFSFIDDLDMTKHWLICHRCLPCERREAKARFEVAASSQ